MRPTCWLLTRFGVDESLVGDLIERRRAGASFVWFAAQCVVAVTWATTRAVRSHPLRAVATILVGLLLRQLTIRLWAPQEPTLDMDIAGGLLSVFSMNQPTLIIAVSMINDAILAPFWFGIGWLVERSCRGASLLFTLIALAVAAPHIARQVGHAFGVPPRISVPVVTLFTVSTAAFVLSTLAGALLAGGRRCAVR